MWIGSRRRRSNLTTPAGAPVPLNAVKINEQYPTNLDIYLRQGLPDRASYIQQPTLGIMPEGTRVQILSVAPPFPRPTGDQYWAQVRVVKLALSTVYFQFAGGARDQAQQLSKALQDKGYRIPGEERTSAAAGTNEVRYFFKGQESNREAAGHRHQPGAAAAELFAARDRPIQADPDQEQSGRQARTVAGDSAEMIAPSADVAGAGAARRSPPLTPNSIP